MDKIVRIGCPTCGSVLRVHYRQGIETEPVVCPVCKQKRLFSQYKSIVEQADLGTNIGNEVRSGQKIGCLVAEKGGRAFPLKEGRNVIGRKAQSSQATIQLPNASLRMSREHIVIEVKKEPQRGYVHYLSPFKDHLNATYVGEVQIEPGDNFELEEGVVIRLPDMNLRFEIPDEEGTVYD